MTGSEEYINNLKSLLDEVGIQEDASYTAPYCFYHGKTSGFDIYVTFKHDKKYLKVESKNVPLNSIIEYDFINKPIFNPNPDEVEINNFQKTLCKVSKTVFDLAKSLAEKLCP